MQFHVSLRWLESLELLSFIFCFLFFIVFICLFFLFVYFFFSFILLCWWHYFVRYFILTYIQANILFCKTHLVTKRKKNFIVWYMISLCGHRQFTLPHSVLPEPLNALILHVFGNTHCWTSVGDPSTGANGKNWIPGESVMFVHLLLPCLENLSPTLTLVLFPGPHFCASPQGPPYLTIKTASQQAARSSNHMQRTPSELPDFCPFPSPPVCLLFHTSLENCVISLRCEQLCAGMSAVACGGRGMGQAC